MTRRTRYYDFLATMRGDKRHSLVLAAYPNWPISNHGLMISRPLVEYAELLDTIDFAKKIGLLSIWLTEDRTKLSLKFTDLESLKESKNDLVIACGLHLRHSIRDTDMHIVLKDTRHSEIQLLELLLGIYRSRLLTQWLGEGGVVFSQTEEQTEELETEIASLIGGEVAAFHLILDS